MTGAIEVSDVDLARACVDKLWRNDMASQTLGMSLDDVGPGTATMSLVVRPEMANGHGTCHGGFTFTLADSAFALACNSRNQVSVAQHCSVTFIAPAKVGDRLTAMAREVSRSGRSGIYDIDVTNQDGVQIALFRGHSRTIAGEHFAKSG